MTDLKNHTDAEEGKTQPPRLVAVTVEELVVYRYHVPADADDPEGIALDRFRNGELPDAGPTEGEQHDLSTYFVGDVEPTPPSDFDDWADKLDVTTRTHCIVFSQPLPIQDDLHK